MRNPKRTTRVLAKTTHRTRKLRLNHQLGLFLFLHPLLGITYPGIPSPLKSGHATGSTGQIYVDKMKSPELKGPTLLLLTLYAQVVGFI